MGIFKKGDNYLVDIHVQGRRARKRVGPNKAQAQAVYSKLKVQIAEWKFWQQK